MKAKLKFFNGLKICDVPYILLENGCFKFAGTLSTKGYGKTSFGGRAWLAHRLVYTRFYGHIPAKMQVEHKCKNTSCINPNHLELLTNKENSRRSSRAKLSSEIITLIKNEYNGKFGSIQKLANKYGVDRSTISLVLSNKTWT